MGDTESKLSKGGGNKKSSKTPKTLSGVTYDQLMKMSEDEKYQTIEDILNNDNIKVPSYLDDSETTKVLYALGMSNKPNVVSDAKLNSMAGEEVFRTV